MSILTNIEKYTLSSPKKVMKSLGGHCPICSTAWYEFNVLKIEKLVYYDIINYIKDNLFEE